MKTCSFETSGQLTHNNIRRRVEASDHTGRFYLRLCSSGVVIWALICIFGAIALKRSNLGYNPWLLTAVSLAVWLYCTRNYPKFISTYVRNIKKLTKLAEEDHKLSAGRERALPRPSFWSCFFSRDPVAYTLEYIDDLPRLIQLIKRERRREVRKSDPSDCRAENSPAIKLDAPLGPPAAPPSEEEVLYARLSAIDTKKLDSYIREDFEKYLADYLAKKCEKRIKVRLYPLRKAAELVNQHEYAR